MYRESVVFVSLAIRQLQMNPSKLTFAHNFDGVRGRELHQVSLRIAMLFMYTYTHA